MSDTVSVDTNFVVYAYMRENGTPYYIGKGRPERPYKDGGRPCSKPSDKKRIIILYENIDEETAFSIEIELIAKYKRKDLYPEEGLLYNRSDGGEGYANPSPESLKKRSEKLKGDKNPMYGKRGPLSPSYGIKRSEEYKKNLSESRKGSKNPLYGRRGPEHNRYKIPHRKETLEKISKFFDWYHPEYGIVLNVSTSRLPEMFLDQKLDRSALCKVSNEIYYQHKNWRLLKNKDLDLEIIKEKSRRGKGYNWFHPDYGSFFDLSCSELIKKFPKLDLRLASLSKVSLGNQKAHKKWSLAKE